ncbi:hypothetical protein IG631_20994 [Alternaria alternata]|nr:hypothetical protein IG631_20994 [Alternaria alternata]
MSALRDVPTIPDTTMRTSDYLLPPLPGVDNLWHSKMNFPVRSSDISTPHERLEECGRFEKSWSGTIEDQPRSSTKGQL